MLYWSNMKRFFSTILLIFCISTQVFAIDESAESLYAKAYGALYKNNPLEAIRIFEKGQKYYPDCAFLFAGMGDVYYKEGNLEKALEYYTLAQRKKHSQDIYKIDFYNAHLQKTTQEISESLNKLFEATKKSNNPILYKNINNILDENFEQTTLVTEIYQNTTDTNLNAANVLKNTDKKEDAITAYLKILNTNPKDFRAANNVGVTLFELKDYELSEKYLNQALENNPNSALILNNLALVNLRKKNFQKMEENFNSALKIKGDYFPAINNRAIANIHRGLQFYQPENIQSILDVIKKDPENNYAKRTLSKMYLLKGDFENANNILEPINSTYNFKLYTQKAFTAYKNKQNEKALEYINKAILFYSDNSLDYEIRGRILTEQGKYKEALTNYKTALEKDPKNTRVLFYQAKTLYKTGQKLEAQNKIREFINSKKGNSQTSQLENFFK